MKFWKLRPSPPCGLPIIFEDTKHFAKICLECTSARIQELGLRPTTSKTPTSNPVARGHPISYIGTMKDACAHLTKFDDLDTISHQCIPFR
ncbi:hypothetical protein NPIL_580881 [Nephila pilipes]|uniref:Uncharacterized protein n=1 Tax=Nephila pilipes TaxID=299642 RepID=A0A8X6QN57_NEPPI|nr:hypothetical protein NPIL_580881 [Nephila pilipes]